MLICQCFSAKLSLVLSVVSILLLPSFNGCLSLTLIGLSFAPHLKNMKKTNEIIPLDMVKVTASNVVLYTDLHGYFKSKKNRDSSAVDCDLIAAEAPKYIPAGDVRKHKYRLSVKAVSRLKKSINYFCIMNGKTDISARYSNFLHSSNISFLTLTLPAQQFHSDGDIVKKCLNHFFVLMRDLSSKLEYIWKAEAQANGNIHFHVLLNRYFHHTILRKNWNCVLAKLGYISKYRERFSGMSFAEYMRFRRANGETDQKKIKAAYDFGCETDWSNPNSIDVHATRAVQNIPAYFVKYFSKAFFSPKSVAKSLGFDESVYAAVVAHRTSSFCRLWYASSLYLNVLEVPEIVGNALKSELIRLWQKFPKLFYAGEHFEVIKITPFMLLKHGFKRLFSIFENNLISYFSTNH